MPKQLHTVDNAGAIGFISPLDKRGFEVDPAAWTAMNSCRMDQYGAVPGWGYLGTGLALDDSCHSLEYMSNRDGDENFYLIGSDTLIEAIYIDPGNSTVLAKKVLRTGFTGDYDRGDTWVTTAKDGHQVMTNGKDAPQMVLRADLADLVAVDLAGFTDPTNLGEPAYSTCKTIIAFNGFLVAGNIQFSGADAAPNMIAWSDRTDTGSIPSTWDYTDPSTLAGNIRLAGNFGDVVAMELVRDELMIYCQRGAYRMQYTGGQYVFRLVPAFDTVGALNPRAVCNNEGRNIIVSQTDIMISDGQYPVSIATGKVRNELYSQLSPSNAHKIQVFEYSLMSEILIICPDSQDDQWCSKVLAWNWHTETWSVRHGLLLRCMNLLPNLVSAIDPDNVNASSTYDDIYRAGIGDTTGLQVPPPEEQFDPVTGTIPSQPEFNDVDQYELAETTYGTLLADEGVLYIFGIGTIPDYDFANEARDAVSNSLWKHDVPVLQYPHNASVWETPSLERTGINLGNDESIQMVTAVYPRMEGSGNINVYIGAVDYVGGADGDVRWDPPVVFNPEVDYRITCRVAGRRHAIRFEAIPEVGADNLSLKKYADFRLAGYDLEFSHVGRR